MPPDEHLPTLWQRRSTRGCPPFGLARVAGVELHRLTAASPFTIPALVIAEHGSGDGNAMARDPHKTLVRPFVVTATTSLMAPKMMFLPTPGDARPARQNAVSRETSGHRRQLLERIALEKDAAFGRAAVRSCSDQIRAASHVLHPCGNTPSSRSRSRSVDTSTSTPPSSSNVARLRCRTPRPAFH